MRMLEAFRLIASSRYLCLLCAYIMLSSSVSSFM